ncbi:MAG TPA: UbiH/UbiF/VisC/COQ6 family ubiquinone biosynthesis hydroxylase [Noviherbaspirillum sp.]|uniref:UbiH/UbiF/VisC/COQ6 family ubiquinone biosynthesis hydroxylase n=1 Tax=Noviherbaspirillum sp. TaxID=1926288 RepID=UPI002B49FE74|nr:UbiH/UbiF/VisC/COQ6 family ubiquinone biosynthesis hydroxylase [Noviherbaspirillum sp.]HJV84743.1 UbiH/UbiF/VisC/COQ6 family ubiquinone biosynthesis hydroxylase [Noviherbaspirillum sp.]
MTTTDFDIAICGAGPVGLALALLLVKHGAPAGRIVLVDAKPLETASQDPRSIALSYGSRQILENIGAWPVVADAIHQIHVSRRGHFGRTIIDREEYGVPALGYVARYGSLVSTLAALADRNAVVTLRPVLVASSIERDEEVELRCADGKAFTAQIMVQAEGGVFSEQATKSVSRDYDQTAVIAHVVCSKPVAHRAFERFTEEGPLALLPQDDGYAMVWCARPANAARLAALPDTEFLVELERAFGSRLGRFTKVSPRAAFPLGLNAHAAVSSRTVAIGNAAQTLHPVAGQGMNLGLRDAAVLARLLAREATPEMLQQFIRLRQTDRKLTITLTDALARIFASAPDGALSQSALGFSLALVDALKPAKRLLAEHMLFGSRQ